MDLNLTPKDLEQLSSRKISAESIANQLTRFREGFPFLKLAASATVGNGIIKLTENEEAAALARWEKYLADGGSVTKFVPASGAASRMFKALFSFINGDDDTPQPGSDVEKLINRIEDLPFKAELDNVLSAKTGMDAVALRSEGRYKEIISAIVDADGMNYGNLPKGLLTFHRYADKSTLTPLEEHMMEGAQTVASGNKVNLHFTVSTPHRELFVKKINEVKNRLEEKTNVTFNISLSEQKPSTDTVAATTQNELFRNDAGEIVFRPGGHGALIENLNDIDSTVVFIKNIDNVVPEDERKDTVRYKKVIGGLLISVHDRIEHYLRLIDSNSVTKDDIAEMISFLENILFTHIDGLADCDEQTVLKYLKKKFDRPVRVCGMVRNEGEPGGGPYLAYNSDGSYSPQILESTQIDTENQQSLQMMKESTHFNPVDLVCYLRDTEGKPYDLRKYVDESTGFISQKSSGGRDLLALELPGLWNGAMSDWSTVFVEVPASTFNPVKTVNDLLRPVHQADKNTNRQNG